MKLVKCAPLFLILVLLFAQGCSSRRRSAQPLPASPSPSSWVAVVPSARTAQRGSPAGSQTAAMRSPSPAPVSRSPEIAPMPLASVQKLPRADLSGEKALVRPGINPEDFAVPFYPGSRLIGGNTATVSVKEGISRKRSVAMLETEDSIDAVLKFYRKKMPRASVSDISTEGGRRVLVSNTGKILPQGSREGGSSVNLEADEESGKTRITLMRIK